jgi:ribosomal protein L12E/L44/L45/RPP1/RPP2
MMDIFHVVEPGAIVDLTASNGIRALLAILRGIPYIGFVANTDHQRWVETALEKLIFREFGSTMSSLHKPTFDADLKPLADGDDERIKKLVAEFTKTDDEQSLDEPGVLSLQTKRKAAPKQGGNKRPKKPTASKAKAKAKADDKEGSGSGDDDSEEDPLAGM